MRNVPTILAAGALLLVLLLYMCTFQVRSTEVAIVKTFGNANPEPIEEPGLYGKWPPPIQTVARYDKRLRILLDRSEETRTADSKNIILTSFAIWTIDDPYKFHVRYQGNVGKGEEALRMKIRSHKMAVAGKHDFSEFVSTDPQERKLREIEQEMMGPISTEALDEGGIAVRRFGIKQLALPSEVTKAVFDSMKKTEEVKAANYRAEGEAQAAEIVAQARASQQRILAVTRRQVDALRNEAQAEVSRIYEAFREHQDLRIFLDKLRTLEEVLKQRTTLILGPETPPVDLFDDVQRLAPTTGTLEPVIEQLGEPDTERGTQ